MLIQLDATSSRSARPPSSSTHIGLVDASTVPETHIGAVDRAHMNKPFPPRPCSPPHMDDTTHSIALAIDMCSAAPERDSARRANVRAPRRAPPAHSPPTHHHEYRCPDNLSHVGVSARHTHTAYPTRRLGPCPSNLHPARRGRPHTGIENNNSTFTWSPSSADSPRPHGLEVTATDGELAELLHPAQRAGELWLNFAGVLRRCHSKPSRLRAGPLTRELHVASGVRLRDASSPDLGPTRLRTRCPSKALRPIRCPGDERDRPLSIPHHSPSVQASTWPPRPRSGPGPR